MFKVYPVYDIELTKGEGCYVWDANGNRYLDLYGGHAVISIGHSHPVFLERIKSQLEALAFYSNSIVNPLQEQLAEKLGEQSGYNNYHLFLCNSGAEAVENAVKLASFHTGRSRVISFTKGFHGRTSMAVALTDNPKIVAPVNETDHTIMLPFNDLETFSQVISEEFAAVIIEGIQGYSGIYVPNTKFLQGVEKLCRQHGVVLIMDEIQSGYGRSGEFFAHQHHGVQADLVTMAKGMGNGFPIGGVLINPDFEAWPGMLGTTFGGNHLGCAAGLAVLEVLEQEVLVAHANTTGEWLINQLSQMEGVVEVRGRGLMIGIALDFPVADLRRQLLLDHHIFTGSAGDKNTLRLLPPLGVTQDQLQTFLNAFHQLLNAKNEKFHIGG